tara:strand:- start:2268 stop:2492 length:225 start_codon:yes stop_codon:yes gene_type:complete
MFTYVRFGFDQPSSFLTDDSDGGLVPPEATPLSIEGLDIPLFKGLDTSERQLVFDLVFDLATKIEYEYDDHPRG